MRAEKPGFLERLVMPSSTSITTDFESFVRKGLGLAPLMIGRTELERLLLVCALLRELLSVYLSSLIDMCDFLSLSLSD